MAAPTFQWQGATANATTAGSAISFSYPASGVASGDVITLFVVNKATSGTSTAAPAVSTPSGWTLVVTMPGGTGNAGIAVGQTRLTLWQKNADADGTENGTTLTSLITVPTGGDITYGCLVGFRRATAGSTLLLANSTGNDTTTGTAYSAVMAADVGVQTDDLLVAMDATPASTNNGVTSPAISQPGCTLGTVTLQVNNGTTAGLDIRESMWVAACTAGTSSGAATISATYGTTAQGDGPGAVWRIREQTTTQVTVNDTGAGADSAVVAVATPLADTGAGSDTAAVTAQVPLADVGVATDSISVTVPKPLSDTGVATDSLTVAVAVPLADVGGGSDSLAVAAAVPLADVGAGTDTISVSQGGIAITLPDTGTATDTLTVTAAVPLAELGAAADTIAATVLLSLAETGTATDSFSAQVAAPFTIGQLTTADGPTTTLGGAVTTAVLTAQTGSGQLTASDMTSGVLTATSQAGGPS